jgi:hypothetical protein
MRRFLLGFMDELLVFRPVDQRSTRSFLRAQLRPRPNSLSNLNSHFMSICQSQLFYHIIFIPVTNTLTPFERIDRFFPLSPFLPLSYPILGHTLDSLARCLVLEYNDHFMSIEFNMHPLLCFCLVVPVNLFALTASLGKPSRPAVGFRCVLYSHSYSFWPIYYQSTRAEQVQ